MTTSAITLSLIGLIVTPRGPFNVIVQFGPTIKGMVLGTSVFILVLESVLLSALFKKKKELPVSQPKANLAPNPSSDGLSQPEINQAPSSPFSAPPSPIDNMSIDDSYVEKKTDPLALFPQEISLTVFSYLNVDELGKSCQVSTRWGKVASNTGLWNALLDLKKISPLIKVFDESDWFKHIDLTSFGLEPADNAPLDKRAVVPILKRFLSSLKIKGNSGITVLTIPKGLTFNKLIESAKSPKVGYKPFVNSNWYDVAKKIGDKAVDKTYRIAIANSELIGNTVRIMEHKDFVNRNGYQIANVLEATAFFFMTYISSKESYIKKTCIITTEEISQAQVFVGCNDLGNVEILPSWLCDGSYGIGGVVKRL